jgi:hypothetical protein
MLIRCSRVNHKSFSKDLNKNRNWIFICSSDKTLTKKAEKQSTLISVDCFSAFFWSIWPLFRKCVGFVTRLNKSHLECRHRDFSSPFMKPFSVIFDQRLDFENCRWITRRWFLTFQWNCKEQVFGLISFHRSSHGWHYEEKETELRDLVKRCDLKQNT